MLKPKLEGGGVWGAWVAAGLTESTDHQFSATSQGLRLFHCRQPCVLAILLSLALLCAHTDLLLSTAEAPHVLARKSAVCSLCSHLWYLGSPHPFYIYTRARLDFPGCFGLWRCPCHNPCLGGKQCDVIPVPYATAQASSIFEEGKEEEQL